MVHLFPAELCRALASGVPDLQADFRHRALVYEINDAPPGVTLRFTPQARASRRDTSLRRDAGHFRVHEAGAAHGTMAVMDEMPAIGETTTRLANSSSRSLNGRNIGGHMSSVPLRLASHRS